MNRSVPVSMLDEELGVRQCGRTSYKQVSRPQVSNSFGIHPHHDCQVRLCHELRNDALTGSFLFPETARDFNGRHDPSEFEYIGLDAAGVFI